MAAPKSLDDMLQADRKKRKAEQLAQSIFGKNRRQSAPVTDKKVQSPGASFASRVGVNKRSSSSSSVHRQKQPGRPNAPSALSRAATVAHIESTVSSNDTAPMGPRKKAKQANGTSGASGNGEINIRGAAGPYTVIAQNFATGTTAADIESVMKNEGGPLLSCRLAASNPTVIAEMVFAERKSADKIIAKFNNKKADGRLLHVYLKGSSDTAVIEPTNDLSEDNPWRVDPGPVVSQAAAAPVEDEVMEIETDEAEAAAYRDDRVRRDQHARSAREERHRGYDPYVGADRRDERRDDRRAEPMYQDGRYGFGDAPPPGPRYEDRRDDRRGGRWGGRGGGPGRMYSDDLMRRSGPPRRW
ncbi:hypothetical protein CAC42_2693 [Sphaceloma murrayae]|uniref:RRM domain-containing protein n=1 Tax=Sphaceloma murrayae TaxID=2082308 RepID=A0A2K1R0D4_9PEZI|nr:hypothetical protein CAC42_2693 [Sphaceloma murrayae]